MNIKTYDLPRLEALAKEIRERILEVVSKNGGHLGSTLGAAELIIAMHKVFDSSKDPFIFDVSHQAYAHKLLTDRWDEFDTLRQFGGISGYTKPGESEHDYFVAGHSSTSISLGVGAAKAIALKGEEGKRIPVVMIGDGSMSAGMAYEALNELGDRKYPMVIILNDNEMSISKPIGAISRMLSSAMASPFYQKLKRRTEQFVDHFGESAHYMAKRFEESFKLITPGIMFEEMGIEYIGPVDGHDLKSLIETLELARSLNKPVLIHTQTTKGKGYEIAEGKYEKWHGVGPFDLESGSSTKKSSAKSATQIYSEALMRVASSNEKVVGVTAAMPSGTGLGSLIETYPDRFWDVAIAEQHAVTFACGLARSGLKPFVAIYSTFLQRSYDQLIHDVALQKLPIKFVLDRAGLVGEDGPTHHGAFDLSYLRLIPNFVLMSPADEFELTAMLEFMRNYDDGPIAIRFPRGAVAGRGKPIDSDEIKIGKSTVLFEGKDIAIFSVGSMVHTSVDVAKKLKEKNIDAAVINARFIKPLDEDMILNMAGKVKYIFTVEENTVVGGFGDAVQELLSSRGLCTPVERIGIPDRFISHGTRNELLDEVGLSTEKLIERISSIFMSKKSATPWRK